MRPLDHYLGLGSGMVGPSAIAVFAAAVPPQRSGLLSALSVA
jgi:hypothetical protein